MFDYASLERRITALENNRGASLRFGTVTESDQSTGAARVQLEDGDGMVSYPLRVLQRRSLKDKAQCMPDLGEPVAVLFAGQGMEQGAILGACYSKQTPPPGVPGEQDYMVYEDGTELWYDRKKHKLIAKVKGDIEAEVEGNITAKVKGNAELKTQGHIRATAEQEILAESAVNITLRAPTITLAGLLRVTDKDGKPGSGELFGSYIVREGSFTVADDNLHVSNGSVLVPEQDVRAGTVSLRGHDHTNVMPGAGVSGPPVGG